MVELVQTQELSVNLTVNYLLVAELEATMNIVVLVALEEALDLAKVAGAFVAVLVELKLTKAVAAQCQVVHQVL